MNTYSKQVSCINKVAKHFAIKGYHVTTKFFSSDAGCEVTVFFHDSNQRESICNYLRKHVDDNDSIVYDEFKHDDSDTLFYIYKLKKYPS